jgi:hypothetical protein
MNIAQHSSPKFLSFFSTMYQIQLGQEGKAKDMWEWGTRMLPQWQRRGPLGLGKGRENEKELEFLKII